MSEDYYTETKWSPYLRLKRYNNIAEMVLETIDHTPEEIVMRWFKEDGETVESIKYKDLYGIIKTVFYGLRSLGLKKGDHISICAETSQYWAWADLGIQCLGGITIAIYPQLKPKEILYIIKDSESIALIIDTQENLKKFYAIQEKVPKVENIIVFEEINDELNKSNVILWEEFMQKGKDYEKNHPDLFNGSIANIYEDDLASLIYTSGTTGIPKGVMLTHKNFLSDTLVVSAIALTLEKGKKPWGEGSITYMPYAHSYGRTVEEYGLIFNSSTINYVGGKTQEQIQKAFQVFKPTIMVGVPYLYQKIYERIINTVEKMSPMVQSIFNSAVSTGKQYYKNKIEGKKNPLWLRIKYWFYQHLILKRIQKEMGGKLQLLATASASISEELILFFWSCGFNIAEGYGLTEAAPATHYSRTKDNSDFRPNFDKKVEVYEKIGTVGPLMEIPEYLNPYENMQQKLTEEGELLLKGPNIMKGYWKKPKLTQAALDDEGWLHTGDLAEIDEDGYVRIIGRKKAIIKLSTGKMISPALVEGMIVPYSRIIAQIVLTGQEKKYLTAIVVPYQEPLKKFAKNHEIEYETLKDLVKNEKIQKLIKEEVVEFTEDVAEFSRPKRFAISCQYFSEKEGFLTPTLKFKRNKVYDEFSDTIDRLYEINKEFLIMEDRLTDFYDMSVLT
ncbi:MAG: long-chain fatty acid--CoA ligase [Promethearchaeia archaeon]